MIHRVCGAASKGTFFWLGVLLLILGGCASSPNKTRYPQEKKYLFLISNTLEMGGKGSLQMISLKEPPAKPQRVILQLRGVLRGENSSIDLGKHQLSRVTTLSFPVPVVKAQPYYVNIVLGGRTYSLGQVKLQRGGNILLACDKQYYKPGQKIYLRALVRSSGEKRVIANREITFEVEDPKGNLLYRTKKKTSSYGVSSLIFSLAYEITEGLYVLRALVGEDRSKKRVMVSSYQLPKIKVQFTPHTKTPEKASFYQGEVLARYFFGKPVVGARVEYEISISFLKQTLYGSTFTDKEGRAPIKFLLPDWPGGNFYPNVQGTWRGGRQVAPLKRSIKIEFLVKDRAGVRASLIKEIPVSSPYIHIYTFKESEKILPGFQNNLHIITTDSEGNPLAAEVKVALAGELYSLKTNRYGLAKLPLTGEHLFSESPYKKYGYSRFYYQQNLQFVTLWARDKTGRRGKTSVNLSFNYLSAPALVLKADRALYRKGETLKISGFSNLPDGKGNLLVLQQGRILFQREFQLTDGKGRFEIPLDDKYEGICQIYGFIQDSKGQIIEGFDSFYTLPTSSLNLSIHLNKGLYRPGEKAKVAFHLTSSSGKGKKGVLGVFIVDEAALALGKVPRQLISLSSYLSGQGKGKAFFDSLKSAKELSESQQVLGRYLLQQTKKDHQMVRAMW